MNLPNLERILSNPDPRLKDMIQKSMAEGQIERAIVRLKIRIEQLRLKEAELLWNLTDVVNASFIQRQKDQKELDKIVFAKQELDTILLMLIKNEEASDKEQES